VLQDWLHVAQSGFSTTGIGINALLHVHRHFGQVETSGMTGTQ
jgi:hypothetical protein